VPLLKFPKTSILLHPAVVALLIWAMVSLLYSLHLSSLLLFSTNEVIQTALLIVGPIIAGSLIYVGINALRSPAAKVREFHRELGLPEIERRVQQSMRLWMLLAVVETIVSGGVPLIWILTGNGKSDFDYGIPSVHGMVDALLLALSTASFALYLYTHKRRHLRIPVFAIVWSIIVVSRGTVFVLLLESGIVYLRLQKIQKKTVVSLIVVTLLFLIVFGFIGDLRVGQEAFRTLAQPTEAYPAWAPSGLLWAYIYATTPINNLILTMHTIRPSFNILFPNTISTLFPSTLRTLIYGADWASSAVSGALVTEALNVSTAYAGPFQDMGVFGMTAFGLYAGILCARYWYRPGFWNVLVFTVFTEALVLSLFFNEFFSLPILGQFVWFYYFTARKKKNKLLVAVPVQNVG